VRGLALIACAVALLASVAPTKAASPRRSISSLIRAWFPEDPSTAVCVARRESTLRPGARNGPNSGLFQINVAAHPWVDRSRVFEPVYNISVARRLFLASWHHYGWRYRWSGPPGTALWATGHSCGA
jgi:hypothetical protein